MPPLAGESFWETRSTVSVCMSDSEAKEDTDVEVFGAELTKCSNACMSTADCMTTSVSKTHEMNAARKVQAKARAPGN